MFEDAGIDEESLTVLLVRGGTKTDVLGLLGAAETPGVVRRLVGGRH